MKSIFRKYFIYTICLILFIVSLYPAYKFFSIFHLNGFSNKNQDWANAGSFFGGIYSAIFSFASVVILSITLILTKKYNNLQLEILLTSQRKEIFCSLFDKLTQKMDAVNYSEMGLENEESYFNYCEYNLFKDWGTLKKHRGDEMDAGTLIDLSINLVRSDWFENNRPYYDVILITEEILIILDNSPEDDKRFFLAYMEANASTRRLYWLFCYLYEVDQRYAEILVRNMRALRIPKGYL